MFYIMIPKYKPDEKSLRNQTETYIQRDYIDQIYSRKDKCLIGVTIRLVNR